MATHKSAIKRHRQEEKRRMRNRHHRSKLRSQVKRIRKALQDGDTEAARSLLPATLSLFDRSAKLGVIHGNAAARSKSRITRAVNKLASGAA
jgi:small subunit ribosomal protein S20